jgi:methyltransferase (TIGR00027 family)
MCPGFLFNYFTIGQEIARLYWDMKDNQSSITASGIAVARAVESSKPEEVRICYDPYAVRFLNPLFYRFMRLFIDIGYAERTGQGVLGFLVARCRYIDDMLQEMLDQGLQQLVIMGAGYDSRAYRFEQLKHGLRVFEVDHPTTQQVKKGRVRSALGELPPYVNYVAIDFNTQSLEKCLFECGYDETLRTFFIWEGVVMYLTQEAVNATLGFILHHSGKGSRVVFDYIYTALLDGSVKHGEVSRMGRVRRFSGEGLTYAIPEGEAERLLLRLGFSSAIDMTSEALHARYFTGPNARRKLAWGYGIASAEV